MTTQRHLMMTHVGYNIGITSKGNHFIIYTYVLIHPHTSSIALLLTTTFYSHGLSGGRFWPPSRHSPRYIFPFLLQRVTKYHSTRLVVVQIVFGKCLGRGSNMRLGS